MPHKRNPVNCEQICGLARARPREHARRLENVALWHERDISHSSVERIILPDSTILIDYMLANMTDIVADMRVFPARMLRNLESTHGLVYSGQVLQDLVEKGMPRDDAYKSVQSNAMEAWETETSFRERVANDPTITKFLDAKALEHTFDLKRHFATSTPFSTASSALILLARNPPPTTPKNMECGSPAAAFLLCFFRREISRLNS